MLCSVHGNLYTTLLSQSKQILPFSFAGHFKWTIHGGFFHQIRVKYKPFRLNVIDFGLSARLLYIVCLVSNPLNEESCYNDMNKID